MNKMNVKNINMTNFTLLQTMQTISKFGSITGRLGYAISKTLKNMRAEFEPFDEERSKLIRKYGEADKDGNFSVAPDSPNFQDFAREVASIADEMVNVDFYQITKEEFDAADYFIEDCSVSDYEVLEALFVARPEQDEASNDAVNATNEETVATDDSAATEPANENEAD